MDKTSKTPKRLTKAEADKLFEEFFRARQAEPPTLAPGDVERALATLGAIEDGADVARPEFGELLKMAGVGSSIRSPYKIGLRSVPGVLLAALWLEWDAVPPKTKIALLAAAGEISGALPMEMPMRQPKTEREH